MIATPVAPTKSPPVPFLDLHAHHAPLMEQFVDAFRRVTESSAFAGGPFVAKFEEEFAAFCGTRHAVAVGNGTDALWLSLLALGIGPGDEVITAPNSFMATAEAISYCGAKPVFVDVDEATYTMNPAKIEEAITLRTRAIIPVHLYGQMADMEAILAIARRNGLQVVEDACQAHGARRAGHTAGASGITGCFSFYPGKNLGAFGEGGGITTNDPDILTKMKVLRDHGQARKYHHSMIGWNARMDGIQGAILSIKLKHLAAANEARRQHAALYDQLLADEPRIIRPITAAGAEHVFHIYCVRVPNRDQVLAKMNERGLNCAIHYPVPIHLQEAYRSLGLKPGSFPVVERCAGELLSLPMFPELKPEQVERVAAGLKECVAQVARPGA
jgi:dTDP-4-amino-4,6-dideoxygalactose transaminase